MRKQKKAMSQVKSKRTADYELRGRIQYYSHKYQYARTLLEKNMYRKLINSNLELLNIKEGRDPSVKLIAKHASAHPPPL